MNSLARDGWKPGFIVIGAAKSATTWLQKQLQCNRLLFMPDPEPHFFSREFDKGLDHYRRFFEPRPEAAIVTGEKSADYLSHHHTPERIAHFAPDVKLVALLRNPVERAYSDYKMFFRKGRVKDGPERYLTSLDSPHPRFLEDGLYARHLANWFDHFPRQSILALLYQDILEDPGGTVKRVSDHIGVPAKFDFAEGRKFENDSHEKMLPLAVRQAFAPMKDIVAPLRGNSIFESVRSLFARDIRYPSLSREIESRMREFYRRDIDQLEGLIGRDLGAWKHPVQRRVPHSEKLQTPSPERDCKAAGRAAAQTKVG